MLLLALFACGGGPVAGIVASPEPLVLDDGIAVTPRVYAVDLQERELLDHPVTLGPVQGDAVIVEGGQLRCVAPGVALVTLSAEPLTRELEVRCRLVKELRVPTRLIVEPGPFDLGVKAIGQDGSALDLPVVVLSADPRIATSSEALTVGRTTLTARVGDREATTELLVVHTLNDEQLKLESGESHIVELGPGHYLAQVDGELAVGVVFEGSECPRRQGEKTDVECVLSEPGRLRIQSITIEPTETRLRVRVF